jgi:hypothetical protein
MGKKTSETLPNKARKLDFTHRNGRLSWIARRKSQNSTKLGISQSTVKKSQIAGIFRHTRKPKRNWSQEIKRIKEELDGLNFMRNYEPS